MDRSVVGVERAGDVNIIQRVKTDNGKLYHHTFFDDDKTLAKNRKLADSGFMDKSRLGLHDDADVRMVISCPTPEQWNIFKKENPEAYSLLVSVDEDERMRGARQVALLHPEWIVHTRL